MNLQLMIRIAELLSPNHLRTAYTSKRFDDLYNIVINYTPL